MRNLALNVVKAIQFLITTFLQTYLPIQMDVRLGKYVGNNYSTLTVFFHSDMYHRNLKTTHNQSFTTVTPISNEATSQLQIVKQYLPLITD